MPQVSEEKPTFLTIFNLSPNKVGGIETYAKELSLQLSGRGWRSVLCFLSPPPAAVREYLNLPDVILESLDHVNSGPRYYHRLIKLLLRHRPTGIHFHFVSMLGPYARIARAFGVKKIFFTDRISRPEGYVGKRRSPWRRWIFRLVMAPLTRIFCVSHYVQDNLVVSGLAPKEKISVVYNGVDLDRAEAGSLNAEAFRTSLGLCAGDFLVVQVGQLIPEKGIEDLLEAAAKVCALNSSVHFLFVGDGTHLQGYRKLAAQSGLAKNIIFSGPLVDPFATGVFAAADLVCQVSRWEEAFGFVIAEAMAASRPVLATRCGGIPELVHDGTTGYLVNRGDIESLAARILDLAEDRSKAIFFGSAGKALCREKFDHRNNIAKLLDLYGVG